MNSRRLRTDTASGLDRSARLLVPSLLLLVPFAVFLNQQAYPLARAEIAILTTMVLLAGTGLGLIARFAGLAAFLLVLAGLAVLAVDLIGDLFFRPDWKMLALAAVLLAVAVVLRRVIARLLTVAGTLALILLVAVPLDHPRPDRVPAEAPPAASDLPLVVHLVLSDHSAVEAIPVEIEGGAAIRDALKSLYLDNGFRLYGRSYSTHVRGTNTVTSLFNFTDLAPDAYTPYDHNRAPFTVVRNRYFETMRDRGYRIDLYQFSYLNFCDPTLVRTCRNFHTDDIRYLDQTALSARTKAAIIADRLLRRSVLFASGLRAYAGWVEDPASDGPALPVWDVESELLPGLASLSLWDRFLDDLESEPHGRLMFFYLMLPHYPYTLDADCRLRTDPAQWLTRYGAGPDSNTDATRRAAYALFFRQIACVNTLIEGLIERLERLGVLDRTLLLIHGDHGPRISRFIPHQSQQARLTPRDLVDSYATHFAVRVPGDPGGYDRRLLPLEDILAEVILNKTTVERAPGARTIYLPGRPGRFTKLQMPAFPLAAD